MMQQQLKTCLKNLRKAKYHFGNGDGGGKRQRQRQHRISLNEKKAPRKTEYHHHVNNKVSFNETVHVRIIQSAVSALMLTNITNNNNHKHIRSLLWYSKQEMQQIKRQSMALVNYYVQYDTSPITFRGTTRTTKYCIRGLEKYIQNKRQRTTTTEMNLKQNANMSTMTTKLGTKEPHQRPSTKRRKKTIIHTVLAIQAIQKEQGIYNEKELAWPYYVASYKHQQDATEQGSMDSVHAFASAVTFVVATKDMNSYTKRNTTAKRRMNLVASAA